MKTVLRILIRALTAVVPAKKLRKRVRSSLLSALQNAAVSGTLPRIRRRQHELVAAVRKKIKEGMPVRTAFVVCDASMFTFEPVFRKMRTDPSYDCFIAVVPRVTRGDAFLKETLQKTYDVMRERYGDAVRLMYDVETRRTESLSGKADLVFTSIIYEEQSSPEYTVENMSVYALVALTSYSYCGLFKTDLRLAVFMPNIVYAWKTFLPNRKTAELWVGSNPKLADNAVTCGYVKMDRLKEFVGRTAPERKKVIIAPHHSLGRGSDGLSISNFLRFSELFLSLPSLYPDIDFIFRPHPLLFTRLATDAWWGREKTEAYRAKMVSHPNVEFQQGGDYFETFAESTAMIHDCGSFLAEYFYLDKPQCYMADNGTERQLLPFGKELFDHAYRAGTERDIIDFIERVIIAGDDPMKKERAEFAAEAVCISYPHAATEITNEISRSFRPEGELL